VNPAPDASPPAGRTIKLEFPDSPIEEVGQMLGRYKLLEKVGEGGCGVVYVADQTEPVRRRVAVKVIKLGMDTKAVVARFEAERQALAMMDHPNIAKVLDAGMTEQGRPYFVMELVRGIRITDYCDQNNLSTPERLELFIKVCQAIQHAHQKGIIHRDIKPSNILVTLHDGAPVPKVIDFGIAKATEGRLTDSTVYTQLHQFVGTPAYMSPEQAEMSGLDIDTRSDIYSLGVLLYELLVGSTPFDGGALVASGIDAMRKTIREQEPVRPSTKLATLQGEDLTATARRRSSDTVRLLHQLRGDLDWIVMKCLEKDRTRRYETANGLASDLRRYLNNEPVLARPPSAIYRVQKLYRRNKIVFASATAVLAALVIGLGVSLHLYFQENQAYRKALAARREADLARESASKQRQQANAARTQAEGLVTFIMEDLQPALSRYGRLPLLRQVAERAMQYFDSLPPELRDLKTQMGRAETLVTLAEIQRASGETKEARAAYEGAVALYQEIGRQNPNLPEAPAGELFARNGLGFMNSSDASISSAEMDVRQQRTLQQARELYQRFPTNAAVVSGLANMLLNRAEVAANRFNKPQDAMAAGLEAESLLQTLVARDPANQGFATDLAQSKVSLASAYEALGQRDKSVHLSEEAAAYFDAALKDDPGNLKLLARAASAEKFLSYRVSSISQKRARDAELMAREHYRKLMELDPSNNDWRYNFAMTHMMECYYLQSVGEFEAARQALKKFDALLAAVSFSPADKEKLMANSLELARLATFLGDNADARAQIALGQTRFQNRYDELPANSFDRIQARLNWLFQKTLALLSEHDWPEVITASREQLANIASGLALRPGDSELLLHRAAAQGFLGAALVRDGKFEEAQSVLQQARAGYRETPPVASFTEDRSSLALSAAEALAAACAKTGDTNQARALLETTVAERETKLAQEPDSWEFKAALASSAVQLASILEPSARRQALLARAADLLGKPDASSHLTADDKAVLTTIAQLQGADPKPR
jgi:serine/threonine protein kinase